VFYRDVGNLSRHLMRFWFYLSPTLYGIDMVKEIAGKHEAVGVWFMLNPWTYLLGSYRDVVYEGRAPDWGGLGIVALVSVLLMAFSIWFFKRVEPAFAKVL
jgi:ABC-type polysaccharide/polyol phosphate export permease